MRNTLFIFFPLMILMSTLVASSDQQLSEESEKKVESLTKQKIATCRKKRGSDYKSDSPTDLQSTIFSAIKTKNFSKLAKYISCDFNFGKADADTISYRLEPEQAAKRILKCIGNSTWEKNNIKISEYEGLSQGYSIYIHTKTDQIFEFNFFKDKETKSWVWNSFGSLCDEVFKIPK